MLDKLKENARIQAKEIFNMPALHEIEIKIPAEQRYWGEENYAMKIIGGLVQASQITEIESNPGYQPRLGIGRKIDGVLVETTIACLQWAKVHGWEIPESFRGGISWYDPKYV